MLKSHERVDAIRALQAFETATQRRVMSVWDQSSGGSKKLRVIAVQAPSAYYASVRGLDVEKHKLAGFTVDVLDAVAYVRYATLMKHNLNGSTLQPGHAFYPWLRSVNHAPLVLHPLLDDLLSRAAEADPRVAGLAAENLNQGIYSAIRSGFSQYGNVFTEAQQTTAAKNLRKATAFLYLAHHLVANRRFPAYLPVPDLRAAVAGAGIGNHNDLLAKLDTCTATIPERNALRAAFNGYEDHLKTLIKRVSGGYRPTKENNVPALAPDLVRLVEAGAGLRAVPPQRFAETYRNQAGEYVADPKIDGGTKVVVRRAAGPVDFRL